MPHARILRGLSFALSLAACGGDDTVSLATFGPEALDVSREARWSGSGALWRYRVTVNPKVDVGECPLLADSVTADVDGRALALVSGGGVRETAGDVAICDSAKFEGELSGPADAFRDGTVTVRDGTASAVVAVPGLQGGLVPRTSFDGVAPGQVLAVDFEPEIALVNSSLVELYQPGSPSPARTLAGAIVGASIEFTLPGGADLTGLPDALELRAATCARAGATRCEGAAKCNEDASLSLCDDRRFPLRIAR